MKNPIILILFAIAMAFTACQKAEKDREVVPENNQELKASQNFNAHLNGDQEVPPVTTLATGQANFKLRNNGTELHYKLIVANIEDVLMAHLHAAPAGQNGGVVAWLYPSAPPPQLIPGRSDGVLAEGVITADDLVGSLEGQPLSALIELMEDGGIYVNVHTEGVPTGEIRGQI